MAEEGKIAGVYHLGMDGKLILVHAYTDEDYELSDIVKLLALGAVNPDAGQPEPVLTIGRADLRRLKVQADAESFDHPEGFIEMCVELYRYGQRTAGDPLRFVSVE